MAELRGTPGPDVFDQANAPSIDIYYGESGDDRITFASGNAIGGPGADILTARSRFAVAAYWDSPSAVMVDLGAGLAQDGFGTTDTLVGVRAVAGSGHADTLKGGAADETFYGGDGADAMFGGAGQDLVTYYGRSADEAQITYDLATDTFKVFKSWDGATDTLTGIEQILFTADGLRFTRHNFVSPDSSAVLTAPGALIQSGAYGAINNNWGVPEALLGQSGSTSVGQVSAAGDVRGGVSFTWTFPPFQPPAGVWAYPEVYWGSRVGAISDEFSAQVSNIAKLEVDYAVRSANSATDTNVMMEIWTTDASGRIKTEIAVNVYGWAVPNGEPYADDSFSGTRTVNYNWQTPDSTHTYVIYRTAADKLSGAVDFGSILRDLVADGIVAPTDYVSGVELGAEMIRGQGALQIDHFEVFQQLTTPKTIAQTGSIAGQIFDVTTNNNYVIDGRAFGAASDVVRLAARHGAAEVTWLPNGHVQISAPGYGAIDVVNIRTIQFGDVSLFASSSLELAASEAIVQVLRESASAGLVAQLQPSFMMGATAENIKPLLVRADATTSVATLSYQFFTGRTPGEGGIDYLVSEAGPNPNNLNSAYYAQFSTTNRYINFASNLGREGEGQARFQAEYGNLDLASALSKAYASIFGAAPSAAKVSQLLNDLVPDGQGGAYARAMYFESYGRDGLDGQGTKAAMVGWLLAEAAKADIGVYARSNDAFLADVALHDAPYGVDLIAAYAKPEYIFLG